MTTLDDLPAVCVKDVYKTYDGHKYVLRGLNMTVPQGCVYGLLGASGCGKSTLLNAIIGLVGLESGEIQCVLNTRRDLGYMPQQLALYDRMTTEETLAYFGNIYNMSSSEIKERSLHLINLLEIPNDNRDFVNMSGGQKRRLSLAAALLHRPTVVILDEPTVGVDPILRQSIWDYLFNLAQNEKTTIIITTHYIEETRHSHRVGLMRSGVLLCEESPTNLLAQYNSESLEDTFVQLSHLQECHRMQDEEEDMKIKERQLKKATPPAYTKNDATFNAQRFKAELMKNWMSVKRDYGVIIYVILIPLLTFITFHFGVGIDPKHLNVAIFNEESALESTNCQEWKPNGTCSFYNIGCRFIDRLAGDKVNLINVNSMEEGLDLVKSAKCWGVMRIPHNYSQSIETLTEVHNFGDESLDSDTLFEYGLVEVEMDGTSNVIFHSLRKHMRKCLRDVLGEVFEECGYEPKSSQIPVKFEAPVYSEDNDDVRKNMVPAVMTSVMFNMPLAYGVVVILEEKISGATARSVATGITAFELIAGHFCVQIVIHILQVASSCTLLFAILEYEFNNPVTAITLLLALGIPGILFSFLIPLWLNTILAGGSVCIGWVFGCTLLGGLMWPIEGMHHILKPMAFTLPTYFTSNAFRDINFKSWGFESQSVIYAFTSIGFWTILLIEGLYLSVTLTKNRVFLGKNAG